MAASRIRVATLLLLVVAVVCSCRIISTSAEAQVAPKSRHLRDQVEFTDVVALSEGELSGHISASSSSSDHHSFGTGQASQAAETGASTSHEPKHEGPTMMSFIGPAAAGVLAILLIGAVIAFKNHMNN